MRPWPVFLRRLNKRAVRFQTRFVASTRALGQPFQLSLQGRRACTLGCTECPTEADAAPLTLDSARDLIDQHPALLTLSLSLTGEPFLDGEIFEIIRYARARQVAVIVCCDLSHRHFDEAVAQRILDADLAQLRVLLGWPVKGVPGGGTRAVDVELAMRNLEVLCRLRAGTRRRTPHITWEVVTREGQDFAAATARAAQLGVDVLTLAVKVVNDVRRDWKPAPWALARAAQREQASIDQPTHSS